jgi:hypothetical protein
MADAVSMRSHETYGTESAHGLMFEASLQMRAANTRTGCDELVNARSNASREESRRTPRLAECQMECVSLPSADGDEVADLTQRIQQLRGRGLRQRFHLLHRQR